MHDKQYSFTLDGRLIDSIVTVVIAGALLSLVIVLVTFVAGRFGVGKGAKNPFKLMQTFFLWTVGVGFCLWLPWTDSLYGWFLARI